MKKYPELDRLANILASNTCWLINSCVRDIEAETPYKAQYILEQVIKLLEDRV